MGFSSYTPKCKYLFIFAWNICIFENFKGTDFENGNSFFFKFEQKIPKHKFFLKTQKFFLSETLSELNFI